MDSKYSVTVTAANRQVLTTTFKTQAMVTAQTAASGVRLGRAVFFDAIFGSAVLPNSTDCEIEHGLQAKAAGALGTSTAFTPSPLDSATSAASSLAGMGFSVEPTGLGALVVNFTLNQRASFRWAPIPGSEIITAATNQVGLAQVALSSTYTGKIADTLFFSE